MKRISIVFMLLCTVQIVHAQGGNMFTLSGGYLFGKMNEVNNDAALTGFRINGLYEYVATEKFIHGFSFGYMSTTGSYTAPTTITTGAFGVPDTITASYDGRLTSIPLYYAPKFIFGKKSVQGFIKGAAGVQFSTLNSTNLYNNEESTNKSAGFYGGLGLGVMKTFKEKYFINLEYEWAYMNMINGDIQDTYMNTVMMGFGWKF